MNGQNFNKLISLLFIVSTLFFPDIHLSIHLPAIQVNDFFIPIITYIVFSKYLITNFKQYFNFLIAFSCIIIISIIVNYKNNSINDVFEIYKILKFTVVLFFFSNEFNYNIKKALLYSGILIGLINILHFFEFKYLNEIIYKYYNGGLNIEYFGKNSILQTSSKRMVGFMGNPNNNAVFFGFLSFIFYPKKLNYKSTLIFLYFTTLAFMCQSRTFTLAYIIINSIIFIFKLLNWNKRDVFNFTFLSIFSYYIAWMLCSRFFEFPIYSNTLINGEAIESNSAMGRIETWKYLFEMILQKPFIGYGPYKNYFYERKIYSENEYILYAWRYGIIGLLSYFILFFYPIKLALRAFITYNKTPILFFICLLFLITALTNNPLTERTLSSLLAIYIGLTIQQHKNFSIAKNET